ncbi:SsrA-binding protein SmpB [Pollutibacter soli]|uniref:SsrA-binding protein SmpB n=1 Tax=Pollutibacter soli TaxID=3034157 RepID=UPI003013E1CF
MELKNRSAYFDYFIDDEFDAGMVLAGTEVKSIRAGKVSFNDSYCFLHKGELWVKSLHIAPYEFGTYANHDPVKERKLLLTARELKKLDTKTREKGFTIIPLKIFFNDKGFAKMKIGLARGKKTHDKRESIKQKDAAREIKRHLKR